MTGRVNPKFVDKVIERWGSDPSFLIPMLQDIQDKYRYLPRPALLRLHKKLNLPLTRIYEVATFYKAFSLEPKGKYIIQVCLGTACHLRGGPRIVDAFKRELGIDVNKTTSDGLFTLQTVNCLGACALAPVVKVNEEVHGQMRTDKVKDLIATYAQKEAKPQKEKVKKPEKEKAKKAKAKTKAKKQPARSLDKKSKKKKSVRKK